MTDRNDQTASLMTPAKLAQVSAPRAPASPAAWLNQMAADAAHQHVRRLGELRREIKALGKHWDDSPVVAELGRLARELPGLDFGLLRAHGLWARVTGRGRGTSQEFAAQFDHLRDAARDAASALLAHARSQQEEMSAGDLLLLELEVEYSAIEKVLDQGARWLQDMRSQLKTRQASPGDAAVDTQVRDDEARCEILVARLKVLRSVSSAAQQVREQAQAVATRRTALLQALQRGMGVRLGDWTTQVQPVAIAADSGTASGNPDAAMESHREFQLFVKDTASSCVQLRAQDAALAQSLEALKQELEPAQARSVPA